jgi:transposase
MDGKLWARVYQTVMTIDYPNPRKYVVHSDRVIVLIVLRASYDDQSINWACRSENWVGLKRPARLPSQSTVSRRSRSSSVRSLLQSLEIWLRQRAPRDERAVAVDGRALTISPHSKDPDARWGYAMRGFGFGYKWYAIWGTDPVPLAWDVRPLNVDEAKMAGTVLVPRLPPVRKRRYLLGDAAYDTNPLHEAVAELGYQLLAPPKRPGKRLGHRPHHPARVRALQLLKTPYGEWLYRQRSVIERQFGNGTMRREGLTSLPAHVRRLQRVKRYVHAKIILNAFRILVNRNILSLSVA